MLRSSRSARARRGLAVLLAALLVGTCEARTSVLQALVSDRVDRAATFAVEPGPSPTIRFPEAGPWDERHGYTRIPAFTERLLERGFAVDAQARFSPTLRALAALGLSPVWREPASPGLRIEDRGGRPLFDGREPPGFADFDAIPPAIVASLLYVENRELLDFVFPLRNPVLEWDRLAGAVLQYAKERLGLGAAAAGGSTLAIQIEKFRHSPRGVTDSPLAKLRQIASATLRAYQDGLHTGAVRRRLVVDYLNSLPLSAQPGRGEVLGLRAGLEAYYGVDFDAWCRQVRGLHGSTTPTPAQALAYAQGLSLVLATRRPTTYLLDRPAALRTRMLGYLERLAAEGVISPALRDAAARARLAPRTSAPKAADQALERKPVAPIRSRLVELLGLAGYPELDPLDLHVESSLDRAAQLRSAERLREIRDPARAAAAGLTGFRLLKPRDAEGVVYSFSLYETGPDANRLRVQVDNARSALDVSEDAKLDLGSTAKLRTLVTYLESLADLHDELSGRTPDELRSLAVHPRDRLTRWAVDTLAAHPHMALRDFLEGALERRYSASPAEAFFTGGGLHHFVNFDRSDDTRIVTVREAFQNSINLPFVRLMRDLVNHLIFRRPGSGRSVLENIADPRRAAYLERFADRESKTYLRQFYARYRGLDREQAATKLLSRRPLTAKRVAVVLRSLEPEAPFERFAARLAGRLGPRTPDARILSALYACCGPDRLSLSDRGYLARVHPLELWLVARLASHPGEPFDALVEASRAERMEVYRWLFRGHRKSAQDRRIRTELEREAFESIHRQWQRTGYPFDSLVPSYATAIGSSADRPAALAELAGILLNDGVRLPTRRFERLGFGEGTPYETRLVPATRPGERAIRSEVAAAVRGAMRAVVEAGTARRAAGALRDADGRPVAIGGKTGTGDQRYKVFAPGGVLIESRAVSRSATFVFTIGDRFYGVVTAYVTGPASAGYGFTSSLPVQVFRVLAPTVVGPWLQEPASPAGAAANTSFLLPSRPRGVVEKHS